MAMGHQLTCLRAARRQVEAVDDVVETALEQLKKRSTGLPRYTRRFAEVVFELRLVNAVVAAHLLLLAQLAAILGNLRASLTRSFLPGSGSSPFHRAVAREATIAFKEELDLLAGFACGSLSPAEPADRANVTRHT